MYSALIEFQIGLTYEATTSFLAELGYETDGFTTLQHRDAKVNNCIYVHSLVYAFCLIARRDCSTQECMTYEGGCMYTRRSLGAKGRKC